MDYVIISYKRLTEVLNYNSKTGLFTWKIKTGARSVIGSVAGSLTKEGYVNIKIDKVLFRAHRLAWLYVHGEMPKEQIDHINGIKSDNRICNLREATQSQNQENKIKPRADNKTGYLGVRINKCGKKYEAQIKVKGKVLYLGVFDTPIEAHSCYLNAKRKMHEFNTL